MLVVLEMLHRTAHMEAFKTNRESPQFSTYLYNNVYYRELFQLPAAVRTEFVNVVQELLEDQKS
jgi:hypothetical protein